MRSLFPTLSPLTLSTVKRWLEKARLLRFVLLQRPDGGWDSSESLSLALEAREGPMPPKPPLGFFGRFVEYAKKSKVLSFALSVFFACLEVDQDVKDGRERRDEAVLEGAVSDCPLTTTADAIVRSTPKKLEHSISMQFGGEEALGGVNATTIWTTALAVASLSELTCCWIANEKAVLEETIVDRGVAFLADVAARARRAEMNELVELIVTGELAEEAELECARWRAKTDANRLAVRFHQQTLKNRMLNQCARLCF